MEINRKQEHRVTFITVCLPDFFGTIFSFMSSQVFSSIHIVLLKCHTHFSYTTHGKSTSYHSVFYFRTLILFVNTEISRSQWPRGLRRRSKAARLLRLWVRIPPGAWMSVCCKCCVLSGRGLCDELIPRPEESYRLWCIVVCDLETS